MLSISSRQQNPLANISLFLSAGRNVAPIALTIQFSAAVRCRTCSALARTDRAHRTAAADGRTPDHSWEYAVTRQFFMVFHCFWLSFYRGECAQKVCFAFFLFAKRER